jgi:hypothetical protein
MSVTNGPWAELFLEQRPRLSAQSTRADWPIFRREQYLLRPDADPVSIDRHVTPYASDSNPVDAWQIAICILETNYAARDIWMGWGAPSDPRDQRDTWTRLGYDVCDETFTSGLSDCGYDAARIAEYRRNWSRKINQWHLLEAPDEALKFAMFTDARVPEHAPFYVFSVYRVASLAVRGG